MTRMHILKSRQGQGLSAKFNKVGFNKREASCRIHELYER